MKELVANVVVLDLMGSTPSAFGCGDQEVWKERGLKSNPELHRSSKIGGKKGNQGQSKH